MIFEEFKANIYFMISWTQTLLEIRHSVPHFSFLNSAVLFCLEQALRRGS